MKPTDVESVLRANSDQSGSFTERQAEEQLSGTDPYRSVPLASGELAPPIANLQRTEVVRSVLGTELADYEPTRRWRSRSRKNERGLPLPEDLKKLVEIYLGRQVQHWPQVLNCGLLEAANPVNALRLADEFAEQFRSGDCASQGAEWRRLHGCRGLAAAYLRYSCENSNPRSLDDQLDAILEAARQRFHFIPWAYVLADSSVSGTIAFRRGYLMAKQILQHAQGDGAVDTLYVYDMSRASRDIVESHKLARFARSTGRNIIGVADGFDLATPQADIQLMAMSMYSQMLISSVRKRVRTGMRGAALRSTSVGRPAFGYKLVPMRDAAGREILNRNGNVVKTQRIDEDARIWVETAYRMFGVEHRIYEEIRHDFNLKVVGGKNNWWAMDIRTMLANPIYLGVQIFNRQRDVLDPETGRRTRVERPRREWIIKARPELRIVSDELWKAARRRARAVRDASPLAGQNPVLKRRLYPKTLLSGTLYCGYCDKPLTLFRAAGKTGDGHYFKCSYGIHHNGGCKLRCKSGAEIERAVLQYLRTSLLGPQTVDLLLTKANVFLLQEASAPQPEIPPLKEELKDVEHQICCLTEAVVDRPQDFVRSIIEKIEGLERRRREISGILREAELRLNEPIRPMTSSEIGAAIERMRDVLAQDPAIAAPAIFNLTGRIYVHAESVPGRRRPIWIAEFRNDMIPALSSARPSSDSPDSYGLGLLRACPKITCSTLLDSSGVDSFTCACRMHRLPNGFGARIKRCGRKWMNGCGGSGRRLRPAVLAMVA